MRKWCTEDWEFELTATDGKAGHCRLGLEKGDKFVFQYECPSGMCPKTMMWSYVKKKYKLNMPFLRLAYPAKASAFSSNAA